MGHANQKAHPWVSEKCKLLSLVITGQYVEAKLNQCELVLEKLWNKNNYLTHM